MNQGVQISVPEDAGSVYTALQSEDDFESFWIAVGDADTCASEEYQQQHLAGLVYGVTSQTICIKTAIPADGVHSDVFRHAMDTIECLSNSSTFSKLVLKVSYDGKFAVTGSNPKEGYRAEPFCDDDDVDDTDDAIKIISYIINRSHQGLYEPIDALMEMELIRKAFRHYDVREISFYEIFLERVQGSQALSILFEDSDDYVTTLALGGIRIEELSAMALWAKTVFAFLKLDGFVITSTPDEEMAFSWVTVISQSEALSDLKRVQLIMSHAADDDFFRVFSLPSMKESIEEIFVMEVSFEQDLNITALDGCVALKKLFLSALSILLPEKPTLSRHDAVALRSTSIELLFLHGFDLSRRGFLPSLISSDHGVTSMHKSLVDLQFLSTTLSAKDCFLFADSWKSFPLLSTLEVVLDAVDECSSNAINIADDVEEVMVGDDDPLDGVAVPRGNPEVATAFVRGVLDCESISKVNEGLLNLCRREIQHHLKMNKVGRRIIYNVSSDADLLRILPKLFERAAMVYPLDGVYSLLRDDLDLAKVFDFAEATSKEMK